MNNADMPAMPVVIVKRAGDVEKSTSEATGLTKREMMAMHAPEVPDWFRFLWVNGNQENKSYFRSGYGSLLDNMNAHGWMAVYFEWRASFADALLAELDRTSK